MTDIQAINRFTRAIESGKSLEAKTVVDRKSSEGVNFADTVKDFLTAVNNSQKEASGKVADVVQGKSENIAEAMIAVEESRISFQLMLEIRNKLVESYKEIQRMQV